MCRLKVKAATIGIRAQGLQGLEFDKAELRGIGAGEFEWSIFVERDGRIGDDSARERRLRGPHNDTA